MVVARDPSEMVGPGIVTEALRWHPTVWRVRDSREYQWELIGIQWETDFTLSPGRIWNVLFQYNLLW